MKILKAMMSRATADHGKPVFAIAFGLVAGYAGGVVRMSLSHDLVLDTLGRPVLSDFIAFWTAGREALNGMAIAAYNTHLEHAAEVATVGHAFKESLGWSYPPLFLFVAAALASLPYALSFPLWGAGTLAIHAGTIAAISRRWSACLIACAAPWVLTGLMSGQNGFLTASLVAAALLCLEDRPVLSGVFLGLLSYKPQFGILFPLALAFGGYWRTFASAAASALILNVLAGATFGFDTFGGFLHAVAGSAQSHLAVDGLGWNKLESIYSLMRAIGMSGGSAWIAQGAVGVIAAAVIAALWRSRVPYALKAASLAAAIPLVTPYVLVYDLPLLTVAGAFLFRQRAFDSIEIGLLGLTVPCVLSVFLVPIPLAFVATLVLAAISARRVLAVETARIGYFRALPRVLARPL